MAKAYCKQASAASFCSDDPEYEVNSYETRIKTAFALDQLCHEITITKNDDEADWQLMMDFRPGHPKQPWTFIRQKDQKRAEGEDSPKAMVRAMCGVIKEPGGAVSH